MYRYFCTYRVQARYKKTDNQTIRKILRYNFRNMQFCDLWQRYSVCLSCFSGCKCKKPYIELQNYLYQGLKIILRDKCLFFNQVFCKAACVDLNFSSKFSFRFISADLISGSDSISIKFETTDAGHLYLELYLTSVRYKSTYRY